MKILFLSHAPNPSHMRDMGGLFEMSFVGPLSETGQADYEIFWIGPWLGKDGAPIDWRLFRRCLEYQPDVVMSYAWWRDLEDELQAGYTSLFTFYLIRKLLNIKVMAYLFDQAHEHFKTTDILVRFCDAVFTHEHEGLFRTYSSFPEKHIVTIATISPKLFHASARNQRDIDLAFVGGIGGYPGERSIGLAALRQSGLVVTTPGGRGKDQKRLSNEEYADFFKRSKIIINWSRHISGGWYQAKARVFEATLAGAMLLCEECKEVNRYFQPYVDYVPFSTTEELVQRARYYLEHGEERLKIAVQGNRTALTKYSADVVWGQMLREIRDRSLYNEAEAVEGLRQNASRNELRVAKFFQRELRRQFPQFDQTVVDDAGEIVEKAHKSFRRKLHRHIERTRWRIGDLRVLHWVILRKLLPSFITRDWLRSILNSLGRKVVGSKFV